MLGNYKIIFLLAAILSVSWGQAVPDEVSEFDSAVIEHSYEVPEESASTTTESDFSEEHYDEVTNEHDHYSDDVFEVSEESTSTTTGSDFNIEFSGDGPTEELHDDETNEYDQNSDEFSEVPEESEVSSSTTTENDFAFEESTETVLDKNVKTADTNMIILWLVVIMVGTFVGTSMILVSIFYVKYRRSLKLHKGNVP